eukprot:ctg_673.g432
MGGEEGGARAEVLASARRLRSELMHGGQPSRVGSSSLACATSQRDLRLREVALAGTLTNMSAVESAHWELGQAECGCDLARARNAHRACLCEHSVRHVDRRRRARSERQVERGEECDDADRFGRLAWKGADVQGVIGFGTTGPGWGAGGRAGADAARVANARRSAEYGGAFDRRKRQERSC